MKEEQEGRRGNLVLATSPLSTASKNFLSWKGVFFIPVPASVSSLNHLEGEVWHPCASCLLLLHPFP